MRGVILALWLLSGTAYADEPTLHLPDSQRPMARHLSDGLVYGTIAMDTLHSFREDDKKAAFINQGCRMGIAIGSTLLLKNLVRRERPDHSNNYSFPSGHSANSMAASSWNPKIGISISIGTGTLRELSGRHYWSDVLAGWGLGLLALKVCP